MNCSMPGLPVHHQLPEFTQTHVHQVSQWCHPAISSSVIPFFSCPQWLPASESFPMSQLFTWGGQRTWVSPLASFLPKNIQDWSPLGWTGWISLQSRGLSRVLFQRHSSKASILRHSVFFIVQLSHPYMTTGKNIALTRWTFVGKVMSLLFFFFLLYNTVLVLPYIDMNPPQVYMSSQPWTPLPPPSPYHLSGSSQCPSPKHPVSNLD